MGEAKRRKEVLGEEYGKETKILPWIPITKSQAQTSVKLANRLAGIGIGLMVVSWIIIRFIGPSFGWWQIYG
ncbi:MAG: DUF2839 domain-containing protein [Cyanobacteria bacterium P01_A01_bin.84]